ncbi:MAG TPA: hypothetical protein DIT13_01320 [Verrucomicrobiales bacterium]|nr:hypothetical protein [Verrucomicrobiales bacterium]HRJ09422.1 nucleotidyl transferase AbiEii/AbiGii toxin family protein [Prosthecobacter sp.]HRK15846.1 nucleotidyl transferase AbiEii/AbiGii toxin family protein [Prosthecobacter sp.]
MSAPPRFIEPAHYAQERLREACNQLQISQLPLLETCLHAFELLGRLACSGLPFLFKGGTSLLLHSPVFRRISTDIDIVTPVAGDELLGLLKAVGQGAPFVGFEEQDRGLRGQPQRRHFRYLYQPVMGGPPQPLLLDVVEDDFATLTVEEKLVVQPWFQPQREALVKVQTVETLLGDKLAAFAPRTTGVPYRKLRPDGSEVDGDLLQIAKQFYDVATLYDLSPMPHTCLSAWLEHVKRESRYRETSFTPEAVLRDTFQACLGITMMNFPPKRRHQDTAQLTQGINALQNHVISGSLSHTSLFEMAGKVAHLTTLLYASSDILAEKPKPPSDVLELKDLSISGDLRFLNPIKGTSPRGLFYWSKAAEHAPVEWIKS